MAELYFIAVMFALILIICTVAMVFFARVYRQEQREKLARKLEKEKRKAENTAEPPAITNG